ncbi:hypothetical protein [Beijerinckia sp. L45]|uniref:hypothetical protein n=1 Tax=Beijerinckia sp. L45 TaxID=1641855 RepID=UPI00131A763C|nr:hypothetical protein [Beijerinckia sp. L45]
MDKILMLAGALALMSAMATPAAADSAYPPAIVQFGPTTEFSTLVCPNFTKTEDGSWLAVRPDPFGLGFVQHIVPPARPIKVGGYIYNNIDLYSQLEYQCGASVTVRARY